MIFLNNYLNRNSLTQTTASASTKRSNLFIQMQPEFKALGTSLMAKLQIQRFIKPFLNSCEVMDSILTKNINFGFLV